MKFLLHTTSFGEVVLTNRQQLVLHGDHYLPPQPTNAIPCKNFWLS